MKFGHATQEELEGLDLALPEDHKQSIIHQDLQPSSEFSVYVGCGKWGIPAWVGPIYPDGTKEKDFLSSYIQRFNAIELNGTFYRLSRRSIAKWAEAAQGQAFKYCPKWSQRITHFKRLKDVDENIQYFMDSVALMEENLGCSFLTLAHNFAPKYKNRVDQFLEQIPDQYSMTIEFRHQDWFTEPTFTETMRALASKGIPATITDVALRRDALHMCLTSTTAFIRFNGYGLHRSDFDRLDQWVDRLAEWKKAGIKEVYFFMHQAEESHTPVLVDYFSRKMNQSLELQLPELNLATTPEI